MDTKIPALALVLALVGCGGSPDPGSIGGGGPASSSGAPSAGASSSSGGSSSGGSSSGGSSSGGSSSGGSSSGGSSSGGSSSGGSSSGNPPPVDAGPACPMLTGAWTGKVDGTVSGAASGTVTGTATLTFGAASGSDYALQSGSQLDVTVDVGGTTLPFTQPVTGTAKCGVLDSVQDITVMGLQVHATAKCTFTATGCTGTWTAAPADNSATAHGTFTVAR